MTLTHTAEAVMTACDCQAGREGRVCWHRGLCRLAHEERVASRTACGYRLRPRRRPAAPAPVRLDQAVLTGRRRSA